MSDINCPYWGVTGRHYSENVFRYGGGLFCDNASCPFREEGRYLIEGDNSSVSICSEDGILDSGKIALIPLTYNSQPLNRSA